MNIVLCDLLQHSQESRRNDQRTSPVSGSRIRSTNTTNVLWEQLRLLPWNVTDTNSVRTNIANHTNDDDNTPTRDPVTLNNGLTTVKLDAHEVEGNGTDNQRDDHTWDGNQQDQSSTNTVNNEEGNNGEDKVGSSNNDGDSSGVLEPNSLENSGGEVHKRVETCELLDPLQTTGNDQGSQVRWHSVDLLDGVDSSFKNVLTWNGVVQSG
ncbi:hypothetical protein WICPIJ_007938 [Wickerhamomyces pijperi]|uniref:Uncharacterized protein n=1 Tax=Wickerhamomyces pijperi TaxID=599730 RepID=A0A9P8TJG8_WICPI|nr:hypothetical protein WICPIJ_007938 [Wickerhamomyces pijperi]